LVMRRHPIIFKLLVIISTTSLSACVHVGSGYSRASTTSYAMPDRLALVVASGAEKPDSKTLAKLAKCINDAATARGLDMDARVYPGTIDQGTEKVSDPSLQQQLANDGINWIHVLHAGESKNTRVLFPERTLCHIKRYRDGSTGKAENCWRHQGIGRQFRRFPDRRGSNISSSRGSTACAG